MSIKKSWGVALLISFFCVCGTANAVESGYFINRFKDNWFVSGAFSGNVFVGCPNNEAYGLGDKLTPGLTLNVGKWFEPKFGLRLGYNGARLKNYDAEKRGFIALHGEVMWNLHNTIGGYKDGRVWNCSPYLGAGWMQNRHNPRGEEEFCSNSFAMVFGLYNEFNINSALAITLDLECVMGDQDFDVVQQGGRGLDKILTPNVGIAYRFKKRGWLSGYPMEQLVNLEFMGKSNDLFSGDSYGDTDSTEAKLNALDGNWNENEAVLKELLAEKQRSYDKLAAELERRNRDIESIKKFMDKADAAPSTQVVFFQVGSRTMPRKYQMVLKPIVEYAKKYGKTVRVTGYADSSTGALEFNLQLSRDRAESVAQELINMGLSTDKLVTRAGGATNESVTEYNRRVVVELVDE